MHIAFVNKSTLLTNDEVNLMAAFCQVGIEDWAHAYEALVPVVNFVAGAIPADAEPLYFFDNADAAGALGYHDLTPQGLPYAKVFVKLVLGDGGFKFIGPDPTDLTVETVLSVADHETKEMAGDPDVNVWCDGSIVDPKSGKKYASTCFEMADAVQGNAYLAMLPNGQKGLLSDFLWPAWFNPKARKGSKFNHTGTLKKPFTVDKGGYAIVRNSLRGSAQIFGEEPAKMKYAWRVKATPHPASRTAIRMKNDAE